MTAWWQRHRHGRASRLVISHVVVPFGSVILASGLAARDRVVILLVPRWPEL